MKKFNSSNPVTPTKEGDFQWNFDIPVQELRQTAPSCFNDYTSGDAHNRTMSNYRLCQIFSAGGDTAKRWYVEYYIYDSGKKHWERKREYAQANRIKDPELRMQKLIKKKQEIDEQLLNGWNPYSEQTNFAPDQTIQDAIIQHIEQKKQRQKHRPHIRSKSILNIFLRWLISHGLHLLLPIQIKPFHIGAFLNYQLKQGNSKRTHNDYHIEISAMFNRFVAEERITKNPCKAISKLRSQSETHVSFTDNQVKAISLWLTEHEPYTLFFCKFIIYCFMRETEIQLLQVKHFDLQKMIIKLPASIEKTETVKVKKIPEIFQDDIRKLNLEKYPANYYIFTRRREPGLRPIGENYFRKRFKKVKDKLELSDKHTMYGLRHTTVSHLLRNGVPWHKVMNATGHTTMEAFQKYARAILAESPEDLSKHYSMDF